MPEVPLDVDDEALGHTFYAVISTLFVGVVLAVVGIIPIGGVTISQAEAAIQKAVAQVTGVPLAIPGLPAPPVQPVTALPDDGSAEIPAGFVFPLRTTQSAFVADYSNALTKISCVNPSQPPCHHDYLAADIKTVPGETVVVAAVSGTIVSVSDYDSCSSRNVAAPRLRLASDEVNAEGTAKWYFYYTHLAPRTLKHPDGRPLRVGDHVNAGNLLALGGPTECARGTSPHLHFDVSHQPNAFSRPSAVAAQKLVDPMPMLRHGFKNLPVS